MFWNIILGAVHDDNMAESVEALRHRLDAMKKLMSEKA